MVITAWPRQSVDIGEKAYEQQFQFRRLATITETAKSLGYTLVPNVAVG